jgi:xanthine dehydrogenase accessory factor
MKVLVPDDVLDAMSELRSAGVPFVLATVIGTKGSTPRKLGSKMIVAQDGRLIGTVGGGKVEFAVVEAARRLFDAPEACRFEWDLASEEAGGMICGGAMEFLLEPFGVRPRAVIFGGGHVGLALSRILLGLRFDVTVVDPRAELMTSDRLPGCRLVCQAPAEAAAGPAVPPGAFCVVANHGHVQDLETMLALVRRDAAYLGLMGSKRKRGEVFAALEASGTAPEVLGRVHCPVGLPIGAETPAEIAISIAAEMVAAYRQR